MNYRNRALLDLAHRGRCVNCGRHEDECEPAHSGEVAHGKGTGIKAHDCLHARLCHWCHTWYDQGKGLDPLGVYMDDEKTEFGRVMMLRTVLAYWREGRLMLAPA